MEIFLFLFAVILASQEIFEPLGLLLLFSAYRDYLDWWRLCRTRRHTVPELAHRLIWMSTQLAVVIPIAVGMVLIRWIEEQSWSTTESTFIFWYLVIICYISGLDLMFAAPNILKTGPVMFFSTFSFELKDPLHVRIFGAAWIALAIFLHLTLLGEIGHTSWN